MTAALERAHLKERRKIVPDLDKAFVQLQEDIVVKRGMGVWIQAPIVVTTHNQAAEVPAQAGTSEGNVQDCIDVIGSYSGDYCLDSDEGSKGCI